MSLPEQPLCLECGKRVPSDSRHQVCPTCLVAQALESLTIVDGVFLDSEPKLSPEEIVRNFPGFEMLECLGRGGMGVVYKARQKSLDRMVAIKVLPLERVGEVKFADRFAREAATLAKLNHPNIVTVHDFGEADDLFYIVMEYVDGGNLRDLLLDGKIELNRALVIISPVCDALQYAHGKGFVHRDIKPENLLLDRDGRIKIADFGIAKLIQPLASDYEHQSAAEDDGPRSQLTASLPSGTPHYAAPEQSRGFIDHRADIYSLGVVFYEMLTGERPASELVAPSKKVPIDVRIDEVVLRALEKEPEHRYQTAGEFRTVMETIAGMPGTNGASPKLGSDDSKHTKIEAILSQSVMRKMTSFLWGGNPTKPTLIGITLFFLLLGGGLVILMLPKFRSSTQVALQTEADAGEMEGSQPDLDRMKPLVEKAIVAYRTEDNEAMGKIADKDWLGSLIKMPENRVIDKSVSLVSIQNILGNHKLAFVRAQFVLTSVGGVREKEALLVFRQNPQAEWKLLIITDDEKSLKSFDDSSDGLAYMTVGGIKLKHPLKPASLLTQNEDFIMPRPGERFGSFLWIPSESPELGCEIAEFQSNGGTRIFVNLVPHRNSGRVPISGLWSTGGVWNWRVWSIAKGGDLTFSETRTFNY